MRQRNLRNGLVVDVRGERGYTDNYKGDLVVNFFTKYGGEGYNKIDDLRLRDIKLVLRSYVKNPKLFPKE